MNLSSEKYKSFLVVLVFLVSSFIASSQTTPTWTADLTPNGANSLVFRFTKQVFLNPTIILARKEFEATTHVKLLLLPRINHNDTSSNSKLENAFDKVFALLYSDETTGNIKFYFNSQNTSKPFAFATSEELWCKFTPAQKDTVEQLLNKVIATSNDLSDFSKLPFESVIKEASNYCKQVLLSSTKTCGANPQQVFSNININSTPAKLNFEQAPYSGKSTGDVDEQQYDALKAYYNNAIDSVDNSNYPIAWKAMIANSSEVLKLKVKKNSPSFNLHNVNFKNGGATETYTTQLSPADSTLLNISISGKPAGSMAEVVAYYTTPKTTTSGASTYPIGVFNVQFYERKAPLNVVLVNVGDAAMPNTSAVEEALSKIYGSIFINWNVSTVTCKLSADLNKNLTIENSGLLSNYPASMQPIIKDFKNNCKDYKVTDANTYYLLFGCTNSSGLLGYMPRARNIGFIFDTNPHTIAHELGHGAFNLKHIFSEDELGEGYRSQTDNLMDYSPTNGSANKLQDALYKHQWDLIHNPTFVGWFQGDDEEAAKIDALAQLTELLIKIKNGYARDTNISLAGYHPYLYADTLRINGIRYNSVYVKVLTQFGTVISPKDNIKETTYSLNGVSTACLDIQGRVKIFVTPAVQLVNMKHYLLNTIPSKNVLLFVNGYVPDPRVSVTNNKIYNFFDPLNYWKGIDEQFIKRIETKNVLYANGNCSIGTSNHNDIGTFASSITSSLSASTNPASLVALELTTGLPLLPLVIINTLCYHNASCVHLNTTPNKMGFEERKRGGAKAAEDMIKKINDLSITFNPQTDIIDIVCHSMGFAYAQGMIDVFKKNKFKLGRYYIIAPENACSGSVNLADFEEVWQYGSNEVKDTIWQQDGVAPQCKIENIDLNPTKGGRVYIPPEVKKGFVESHTIGNYGWIFTKTQIQPGYVKKRD